MHYTIDTNLRPNTLHDNEHNALLRKVCEGQYEPVVIRPGIHSQMRFPAEVAKGYYGDLYDTHQVFDVFEDGDTIMVKHGDFTFTYAVRGLHVVYRFMMHELTDLLFDTAKRRLLVQSTIDTIEPVQPFSEKVHILEKNKRLLDVLQQHEDKLCSLYGLHTTEALEAERCNIEDKLSGLMRAPLTDSVSKAIRAYRVVQYAILDALDAQKEEETA